MVVAVIPNLDKRGASEVVEKLGKLLKEENIDAFMPILGVVHEKESFLGVMIFQSLRSLLDYRLRRQRRRWYVSILTIFLCAQLSTAS